MSEDLTRDPANGTMEVDAPPALKSSNHWVLRNGKKPVNREGDSKGWADPSFWMTFDQALDAFQSAPGKFSGLGYIVERDSTRGDRQIIGGDLDNCRDPITGWVSPWAQSILSTIRGCTSVSISGCGFRFFCLGKLPDELNKVIGHGPEDLTVEAITNIIEKKPDIKNKIAKGESACNGLEIYESGPRHLTITGVWLDGYPEDLPNRTSELLQVIAPFLEKETPKEAPKDAPQPCIAVPSELKDRGDKLPFLNIKEVMDLSGFTSEGDELVGAHPVFGSSTGCNLKVNLSKNAWYYFHAGSETGGDSWLWLACECGAIAWEDCKSGALRDAIRLSQSEAVCCGQRILQRRRIVPGKERPAKCYAAHL